MAYTSEELDNIGEQAKLDALRQEQVDAINAEFDAAIQEASNAKESAIAAIEVSLPE